MSWSLSRFLVFLRELLKERSPIVRKGSFWAGFENWNTLAILYAIGNCPVQILTFITYKNGGKSELKLSSATLAEIKSQQGADLPFIPTVHYILHFLLSEQGWTWPQFKNRLYSVVGILHHQRDSELSLIRYTQRQSNCLKNYLYP